MTERIDKILEQLGEDIVEDAKKNLKVRKINKLSSGKLSKSLFSTAFDSKCNIFAVDYAEFVDQGTREIKGNKFLTDAVDDNIKAYGDKLADAVGDDILDKLDKTIQ